MKLWIKIGIIFFVTIMFSHSIFADEPPSWQEFEIKSTNGRYMAKVTSVDENKTLQPWECKYKLVVYETREERNKELWSCVYDYDGYSGGLLSDDGSTFAYINFWYYDTSPVVSIYQNGSKVATIKGKDFNIPDSKLINTVSHRLWLTENDVQYQFKDNEGKPLVLEIITIDGKKHIIDVKTGKISG